MFILENNCKITNNIELFKKKFNIIGIIGPIGSGKSTISNYLVEQHQGIEFAFGNKLKDALILLYGLDRRCFYGSQYDKLAVSPFWNTSGRQLCQFIGTNIFRHQVDEYFWIKCLHKDLIEYINEKVNYDNDDKINIIISDIRFQNEFNYIKNLGGEILYISREKNQFGISDHESEKYVRDFKNQKVINIDNNETLEILYNNVKKALRI
jgi:hypothetical protein